MSLLQGDEIARFVVGNAINPAAVEDADPLESECTKRCLVASATGSAAVVEGLGPKGSRDGLAHPFDEGLAQKRRASPAPVDPALVTAAFGDGCDAHVLLKRGSIGKALATFTEGSEQTRRECGSCPW